jgi:chromosomal replication initiation ATPase DnaA
MSQLSFDFYSFSEHKNLVILPENNLAYQCLMRFFANETKNCCFILFGANKSGKKYLLNYCAKLNHKTIIFVDDNLLDNPWYFLPNQYYVLQNFNNLPEKNLFHLLNIVNEKKSFLILLDTQEINFTLPDLVSRLKNIDKQSILLPSKSALQDILLNNLAEKQIVLPKNIIDYLLKNITSYQDLYIVLKKLEFFYIENNKKINLATIRRVL